MNPAMEALERQLAETRQTTDRPRRDARPDHDQVLTANLACKPDPDLPNRQAISQP